MVLNESKRAKTDDIIEAIKNAITRILNTIRAKGLKPRYKTNYINWCALTNNWDAIKVKPGDRRFLQIKSTVQIKEIINILQNYTMK